MMENMSLDDQDLVWRLLSRPLLIIEQFLMNSKLEILTKLTESILPITSTSVKCPICSKICDSNNETDSVVVFNIDLIHDGNFINSDCVDLLLRLYAAKALDFRIVDSHSTITDMPRQSDTQSLDSLSGSHQMPKEVPHKSSWVKDSAVSTCMCCKRSKFTLLNRRHHCRRCGRVVSILYDNFLSYHAE